LIFLSPLRNLAILLCRRVSNSKGIKIFLIDIYLLDCVRRRGMSVIELGRRAGVDRRTVAQLESGRPGVSLGLFFQVLSLFNLAKGIEEFLKPENDIATVAARVRQVRKRQRVAPKISDEEVNF